VAGRVGHRFFFLAAQEGDANARQPSAAFVDHLAPEPALRLLQPDLDRNVLFGTQAQVLAVASPVRVLRP